MPIALTKAQEMSAHWLSQIEQCDRETNKWHKRGEKIARHYRDERDDNTVGVARRLNLFWANTETLKPVIYSKTPVPICERRFLDKDPVGRVAATILERNLRYEVQMSGFDLAVRRARNDYLLVGRGQVWIRYNPVFGEPISPEQQGNDDITDPMGEIVKDESQQSEQQERELLQETILVDYLHWQDYYTFPAYARTEDEIEGKGRRLFMSRSDMKDAGFKDWNKIPLTQNIGDKKPLKSSSTSATLLTGKDGMQAVIYEIWWKPERKVYFVAKGWDRVCKEADDPLKLEGFFPCPCPVNATMTNDTTIPVPDYAESQDQYSQIDDLSKRIDILTSATKMVGVYDASAQSLKRVFEEASEPNLIPVDSWAMFAEKGGLKGAIDWVPVETIAGTLKILIEVRQQIIADLDRTTGISDIMRGTSDARETMGAQRLKTNNTATRIQERQDDMARFCRDIIGIMGEIVAEQYRPETLIQVSGAMLDEGMDPPPVAPQLANQMSPQPLMIGGPPPQSPAGPPMGPFGPGSPSPSPVASPTQPPGMPSPGGMQGPPAPNQASAAGGAGGLPSFGLPPETPQQKQQRKLMQIMQAIALLRQDKLRGFRIDIETDSTIAGDAAQEKAERTEFISQVTKFVQVAAQTSAGVPEFAPLAARMLQFAVRGFRVGRDLESAIEDFTEKAELDAKAKATQPPQPTPDQQKADTDKALAQHKIASEGQQNQIAMSKAQAEIQSQQIEAESEKQNAMLEGQRKQMEMEWEGKLKMMDYAMKEIDQKIALIKAHSEQRKADMDGMDYEHKFTEHKNRMEVAEAEHRKKIGEIGHSDVHHINGQIGDIGNVVRGIAEITAKLHDHIHSPAEIRRGPDGRAASVVKGGIEKKIVRGPDGKAMMLQ